MKKLGIAVALAALAACAGMGGGKGQQASEATVPDADLGRLAQGQMGPVDEARQFLGSARNEQARAKLHLQEVQHENELATADAQSAKADADRAGVQAKVANDSRDPGQLEQARVMRLQADAKKRAAEARADYAKKLAAARQASLAAADQQVALGEARLERGKLVALQQANVPAASKYDMAKFDARVANAQKTFDQALQKARDQESQAMAAQQTWDDAQRQAQSQAVPTGPAATPTGTGSVNQVR
jgi:colicin import membrane protein